MSLSRLWNAGTPFSIPRFLASLLLGRTMRQSGVSVLPTAKPKYFFWKDGQASQLKNPNFRIDILLGVHHLPPLFLSNRRPASTFSFNLTLRLTVYPTYNMPLLIEIRTFRGRAYKFQVSRRRSRKQKSRIRSRNVSEQPCPARDYHSSQIEDVLPMNPTPAEICRVQFDAHGIPNLWAPSHSYQATARPMYFGSPPPYCILDSRMGAHDEAGVSTS